MWYTWIALLLVSSALVEAGEVQGDATTRVNQKVVDGAQVDQKVVDGAQVDQKVVDGAQVDQKVVDGAQVDQKVVDGAQVTETSVPVATTRPPPRTLDRQASDLAWSSWLQSPESGNPNAPPRRITTKSLFITPLVCPKGQRLDRNGCVQVVTVEEDEHKRILLEHLNALFTSSPGSSDVQYDYGDDEPLQLSIPIGYDPQTAPLQSQDQANTGQDLNYVKIDKKEGENTQNDASIEAELELLKLQQANDSNITTITKGAHVVNHNSLTNYLAYPEKPKRDSPMVNSSEVESLNTTDLGQKEEVYGQVSVDPVIYNTDYQNQQPLQTQPEDTNSNKAPSSDIKLETVMNNTQISNNATMEVGAQLIKKENGNSKLNPEHDYSDIGEAIKLISRYAEVTTDDNFAKTKQNNASKEDNILGTRTKLQYRRNKPKEVDSIGDISKIKQSFTSDETPENFYPKKDLFFRYSWPNQHLPPQSNYPFKHLQDYWPGQKRIGGVYAMHENPRRHHHTYPHNYLRPHNYPYADSARLYPRLQETYSGLHRYPHRVARHNASPIRSHVNNQDLYSLLGLRHWFSSEGTSKR